MPTLLDIANDLHLQTPVPPKVHRPEITARVHKRRSCIDGRVYVPVQFTVPASILAEADYPPNWRVDKRYWVAGASFGCGLHKSGTHPADGAASGQLEGNLRVVSGSTDVPIFTPDLHIDSGEHGDEWDPDPQSGTYNPIARGEVNVKRLKPGQLIYARITDLGSAGSVVFTLILVPVRSPVEAVDDALA